MHDAPLPLLLLAAAMVAVLHSILPDHWVPLAILGRTQRWSLLRVARVSSLASAGHVITSVVLAGLVAAVGLEFREQVETQQGRIIGAVLILTGLGFLFWSLTGHAYHNHQIQPSGDEDPIPEASSDHLQPLARRLAAIAVPFGVAASPDLTILPVALAAAAVGAAAVAGVLVVFTAFTMATFVGLTLLATVAGYQIKGEWLEHHATTVAAIVLIAIGALAFGGF